MDITALRIFATVAREGSLSRAAERLHLTQPAVSLQVKALQERLNLRLFERAWRNRLPFRRPRCRKRSVAAAWRKAAWSTASRSACSAPSRI